MDERQRYGEVAKIVLEKRNIVAFTGAGISVDSGIPAFRGGQGLWEKYDPMEYAHIEAFIRQPGKVWNMLREMGRIVFEAKPSPAHRALATLERHGLLNAVITQNVDGLHQAAGNTNVIEYHGNHRRLICLTCQETSEFTETSLDILPYPTCPRCGEPLKPDAVFFGEAIPAEASIRATEEALHCGVLLIIGTSGVVYPAAAIPSLAASHGATVVEINVSKTAFTSSLSNYYFEGSASVVLPELVRGLGLESAGP